MKGTEVFPNDILICRLADPVGRSILAPKLNTKMVTAVDIAIAKPKEDVSSNFLVTVLNTPQSLNKMSVLSSGSTRVRISRKNLETMNINVPERSEQIKIGNIISKLNNVITLYQQKLSLLKQLKQGMLQKLFANSENNQPLLRFNEFHGDWEQRKLGELSERVMRKNTNLSSVRPLTISAQDGLVDQTTYFHKQIASKQLANYILVLNGEFAYNKSYSVGYPYGAIKRLNKYNKGVLSTLYIVFKPKNVNSDFLEQYYDSSKWYSEIYRNAAEGARNHGLLNISATDFFKSNLSIPKDIGEQKQIGNLLLRIDRILSLYQNKINTLTNLKKFLLQQMFI